MAPTISIIVPVYKVEPYLRRCLDSIQNQTFTDWECILIDDGSPDNSGKICDEYAQKDERFRVIHQENAGASAARNTGLEVTKGEWIGFVDADDWIESDMYDFLYKNAIEKNVNIACCSAKFYENGETKDIPFKNKGDIFYKFQHYQVYMHSLWNKLIKKDLIGDIRLNTKMKTAEDLLFVFNIFTESRANIFFSTETHYYYFQENVNSSRNLVYGESWIISTNQLRTGIFEIYRVKNISGKNARKYYDYIDYRTTVHYINKIDFFDPEKYRTTYGKWKFSACDKNTFFQVLFTSLKMDFFVKFILLVKNKIKQIL